MATTLKEVEELMIPPADVEQKLDGVVDSVPPEMIVIMPKILLKWGVIKKAMKGENSKKYNMTPLKLSTTA